jgi:hypothetical protein
MTGKEAKDLRETREQIISCFENIRWGPYGSARNGCFLLEC